MAIFDLDACLAPVSGDAPCGEAMDYDLDFLELETAARRKPRAVAGDAPPDAAGPAEAGSEAPDWTDVLKLARSLAGRSMDLRIGLIITRAAMGLEGYDGLRQGLELMAGYVERYWQQVHPCPDEGDDDTVRLNALANLCDTEEMLYEVKRVPVARSRRLGTFAFIGRLDAPREAGEAAAGDDPASAFRETDPGLLQRDGSALAASLQAISRIDAVMRERVGEGEMTRLDVLVRLLRQIKSWVDEHSPVAAAVERPATATDAPEAARPGEGIRDRADVVALLNQICRWYQANEPASPVPLLLDRASRLVSQDFAALLAELAPGGLEQFRFLAGLGQQTDR